MNDQGLQLFHDFLGEVLGQHMEFSPHEKESGFCDAMVNLVMMNSGLLSINVKKRY